jgi:2-polyprenyl-3-methyl-5-hydroxy-6-metoxy-1,4-benzoquinol methylase
MMCVKKMSEEPEHENLREKWNRRYATAEGEPRAARVLQENRHLLPASGDALDLACGLGGNALLLAQMGLSVHAWDLSAVAIDTLQSHAMADDLPLQAVVRDVTEQPPLPATFDVIVVSYFLERDLAPVLCAALRPGGLLFYQTFIKDKVSQQGPSNPDYLLAENELLTLFAPLRVRVYREEGCVGDTTQGLRDEALLVGQKAE